jgi:pyridoxamine 5'-phosphate oxidase
MSSNERDDVCDEDPLVWFSASFERAKTLESFSATRAALATVSAHGQPSVRYVLVKRVDDAGFVFFTNVESRKACELRDNPRAALAFHWASIGEQIRVEGEVARVSDAESDAYFAQRPRGSQLGAWASQQSAPIAARAELEAKLTAVTERFADVAHVPRPAFWGGYRVIPSLIEFWSDRSDRLHDRVAYTRDRSRWRCTRLSP